MKLAISLSAVMAISLGKTVAFVVPASRHSFNKATPTKLTESRFGTTSSKSTTHTNKPGISKKATISSLTVPQLKVLLRQQGLKVSGNKSELVERLMNLARQMKKEKLDKIAVISMKQKEKQKKTESIPGPSLKKQVKLAVESGKENMKKNINKANAQTNSNGFKDINVPLNLVARLDEMGIKEPTPIQEKAIPLAIQGKDVMGVAQTGTGKTLAFGLPLVSQMMEGASNTGAHVNQGKPIRGLVLAPTRELANQIAVQLGTLTEKSPISTFVVVGGQNIKTQINKLRRGTDLLVATPGRLIDLMNRGVISLRETSFLVLDEADLMLDMGFLPDLRKIAKMLPKKRQTMLFSATMSKDMNEVAKSYLQNPVRIEIARAGKTADKIVQEVHFIERNERSGKLLRMLKEGDYAEDRAIVFGRTKHGMEKLSKKLIDGGIQAASIHGNKSQPQRDKALAAFKSGEVKVLVATDVAARGLDIPDVKRVYNYELPNMPEAYVHRIGRTARAGKEGVAISFCSMEEMEDLVGIQKLIGIDIPIASGTPWTKHEMNREKDRIKANKAIQVRKRRENSNKKQNGGGGNGNRQRRR